MTPPDPATAPLTTVTCPYCGQAQPAATYCSKCRTDMARVAGVRGNLDKLEARLGNMRRLCAGDGAAGPLLEELKGLAETYQALKASTDHLSRSQRETATLAEVGRMINSVLAMDELLELVMDMAIKVMNGERGFLMLKDSETGDLAVQVARHMEEGQDKGQVTISSNIASKVASDGTPILATDAQNEDRFQGMQSVMAYNIRSLVCVPLKLKTNEIIGVIYVDNRMASGVFTNESLDFLTGFAHQAATAIENARLYQNVQKETRVRMNLQRFLSPSIVDDIMKRKETLSLGGKRVTCTVMFADICGFTTFSQHQEPERVVQLLNDYFSHLTDIIFEHQGTLDKFIGDCIMAVFGSPVPNAAHAKQAVLTAFKMQQKAKQLQDVARTKGEDTFAMRIGINTGPVVAGNIGSTSRMDYTVIGDHVNLASRLQGVAEPGGVVISDATYQQVKELVEVKKLPAVTVKGRNEAVEIYEVTGLLVSEEDDKKNLRRVDRHDVSLFAVYRDSQGTKVHQGFIKNISKGGVQLSTREEIKAGSVLTLSFSLSGGEKVGEIKGKVVRSQQLTDERGARYFKLGIQFDESAGADWEKISRFCQTIPQS